MVRRIPFGKRSPNVTRVASLIWWEERLRDDRFLKLSWKFPRHNIMIMGAGWEIQLIFMEKRVPLPRESLMQRVATLIKCISSYFPGNFGITNNAN